MIKSFTLLALLTLTSVAGQSEKCNRCFIGKEYMKCSYYVEKMADLSKQSTCLTYANSLLKGESPGRASWYYIVGGDLDKAIEAGEKAVSRGEYFAYESLGEAWLLKANVKKAQDAFTQLRARVPGFELLAQKHFETLHKLYPEKITEEEFNKITAK